MSETIGKAEATSLDAAIAQAREQAASTATDEPQHYGVTIMRWTPPDPGTLRRASQALWIVQEEVHVTLLKTPDLLGIGPTEVLVTRTGQNNRIRYPWDIAVVISYQDDGDVWFNGYPVDMDIDIDKVDGLGQSASFAPDPNPGSYISTDQGDN